MLDQEENNELLARWIADDLSPKELIAFQSKPEYETYKKIKAGADALTLREYDIESALNTIKNKDNEAISQSKPVRKLWPYITVAASILVIIGIFLFPSGKTFTTDYGQQLAINLPDGSEVILNAKSSLSFDEQNWDEHRNVDLDGEAYFKVSKGNKFTVKTKNGDVSVLGTQFNVQSYDSFFETICYEGKVRVLSGPNKEIVTAGKAFRNIKNLPLKTWSFDDKSPSWVSHTSSFESMPVPFVLDALKKQYNLSIKIKNITNQTLFTGTFPNDNKEVALKTVFNTLGFSYRVSEDGKTVIVEP